MSKFSGLEYPYWTISGVQVVRETAPRRGGQRRVWVKCTCGYECERSLYQFTPKSEGLCVKCSPKMGTSRERDRHWPTYRTWQAMKQRCLNPNREAYKDYAGRGVQVWPAWHSYTQFVRDLGQRPPGTSLDRIDNGGNYEPGNCRWATVEQQADNKRNAVFVEGLRLKDIAATSGLPRYLIKSRYFRLKGQHKPITVAALVART